jgi:hypothetical protein
MEGPGHVGAFTAWAMAPGSGSDTQLKIGSLDSSMTVTATRDYGRPAAMTPPNLDSQRARSRDTG